MNDIGTNQDAKRIKIVDATPQDVDAILHVRDRGYINTAFPSGRQQASSVFDDRSSYTYDREALLRMSANRDDLHWHVWVAKSAEEVVGFGIASTDEDKVLEVGVLPDYLKDLPASLLDTVITWFSSKKPAS